MKTKFRTIIDVLVLMIVLAIPVVSAVDLSQTPSPEDQAKFDQILSPVMKVYNLVKYSASAIAALMLVFVGISYMTSSNDPKKRDGAKSMGTFVIIGLVLIWATPALIGFLVG